MPLSAIVSATGALTVPLLQKNGKPNGKATISLVAEEQQGNNDVVHFECHGVKLAALDFFGSSDPILVNPSLILVNHEYQIDFRIR